MFHIECCTSTCQSLFPLATNPLSRCKSAQPRKSAMCGAPKLKRFSVVPVKTVIPGMSLHCGHECWHRAVCCVAFFLTCTEAVLWVHSACLAVVHCLVVHSHMPARLGPAFRLYADQSECLYRVGEAVPRRLQSLSMHIAVVALQPLFFVAFLVFQRKTGLSSKESSRSCKNSSPVNSHVCTHAVPGLWALGGAGAL